MPKYLLLLFLCMVGSNAYSIDGNMLLRNCQIVEKAEQSDADAFFLQWCFGYIQGVIDNDDTWYGLMSYDKNHTHDKGKYCLPEEPMPYTQLARIVVKYLKEHPENLHWNGSALVHNALIKAFPVCRVIKPDH